MFPPPETALRLGRSAGRDMRELLLRPSADRPPIAPGAAPGLEMPPAEGVPEMPGTPMESDRLGRDVREEREPDERLGRDSDPETPGLPDRLGRGVLMELLPMLPSGVFPPITAELPADPGRIVRSVRPGRERLMRVSEAALSAGEPFVGVLPAGSAAPGRLVRSVRPGRERLVRVSEAALSAGEPFAGVLLAGSAAPDGASCAESEILGRPERGPREGAARSSREPDSGAPARSSRGMPPPEICSSRF